MYSNCLNIWFEIGAVTQIGCVQHPPIGFYANHISTQVFKKSTFIIIIIIYSILYVYCVLNIPHHRTFPCMPVCLYIHYCMLTIIGIIIGRCVKMSLGKSLALRIVA